MSQRRLAVRRLERSVSTADDYCSSTEHLALLDCALHELDSINSAMISTSIGGGNGGSGPNSASNSLERRDRNRLCKREKWLRRNQAAASHIRTQPSLSSSLSSSSNSSSFSSASSSASLFGCSSSSSSSSDSFSCDLSLSVDGSICATSAHRQCDKVARRLSKPKSLLFRPYHYAKPRRLSLQLATQLSSHAELDAELEADSTRQPHLTQLNLASAPLVNIAESTPFLISPSALKYSRLSEKENLKVKSNPTSPSKSAIEHGGQADAANYLLCATNIKSSPMTSSYAMSSSSSFISQQGSTANLVRSKSLDDLICIDGSDLSALNLSLGIYPTHLNIAATTVVASQLSSSPSHLPSHPGCISATHQLSATNLTASPADNNNSSSSLTSCDMDSVLHRISTLQV